jgi:DNA modification methylase
VSAQEVLEAAAKTARLMPIAEMYPAPWNPREITEERLLELRKSMDADPGHLWARPLMRREDGMIIAGNHRLQAAQLGPDSTPPWPSEPYESLPAVEAHGLSDDDAQLIALRDNENYAIWKDAEVAAILGHLGAAGIDLGLSGFSRESVTKLLDGFQAPAPEGAPDPDDAPAAPKKPTSKPGELYELGPHRLICGDCRDPEVLAALVGEDKIDAMWTDPPYGVDYVGKTADALTIQGDGAEEAGPLFEGMLAAVDPYLKGGARYYVATPDGPVQMAWLTALLAMGWRYHQNLVWVKNVMVLGHSDYQFRHEDVLYGYKPGRGRTGRGAHSGTRWYGDHSQVTTLFVDKPSRSSEHPTMKPIELITAMLKNSTRRNDVVIDPFGGSGSTLIACETLGRRCLTIELDPAYCDVIRGRWERFTEPQTAAA